MDCPGCGEKIHEEELIDGACPLCGKSVESDGKEDAISEIVEMFEGAEAVALDIEKERPRRSFVLHASPSLLDRLKPKKCGACGRWHLKFGDKELHIEVEGHEGTVERKYICCLCT